jgi:hypothetical protein
VIERDLYDDEHEMFRPSFRSFLQREVLPRSDDWEEAGIVDRELFRRAGDGGFLGMGTAEEYGNGGTDDFRYNAVSVRRFNESAFMPPQLESRFKMTCAFPISRTQPLRNNAPDGCLGSVPAGLLRLERGAAIPDI